MEKYFNIEKLSNSYGHVYGLEEEGKFYLLLDDYSGTSKVEISKRSFMILYMEFNDVDYSNVSWEMEFEQNF